MNERNNEMSKTGLIYKIRLLDDKLYIGRTSQSLDKRMYTHAYNATKEVKADGLVEMPFLPPYRNFQGKDSSIRRLVTNHKKANELKQLSMRDLRRWLVNELMRRTEVVEEVPIEQAARRAPVDPTKSFYNFSNPLARTERDYIYQAWVENPYQLVNYNGLPFHAEMKFELFNALNESMELMGNCGFSKDETKYYLMWDFGFEWDVEDSNLTADQLKQWEDARIELRVKNQEYWNSLTEAEKEAVEEKRRIDYEDEKWWVSFPSEYVAKTFDPEPPEEEIAQVLLERLVRRDREVVMSKRKSLFSTKKAELAKKLKVLNDMGREERQELVDKNYYK